MASTRDVCSQHESIACPEFSAVPVRHRKILDKLARCSYCRHLCCCIEHCLLHESKHAEPERIRKVPCVGRTHEWIEASESALSSRVVRNEFPFFCVYCRMKVNDENDLKHLMDHGPQCPVKKCHWMIPLILYHEETKEEENKENIGVTEGRDSFQSARITPRKTPEKSLLRTALRNCLNLSLRTPPPANYEGTTEIIGPLTSTPESDCDSYTQLENRVCSPTTPEQASPSMADQPAKEPVGILSTGQRSRIRPKATTRKVTFACDSETERCGIDGSERETENTENMMSSFENNKKNVKFESKHPGDEDTKENLPLKPINN